MFWGIIAIGLSAAVVLQMELIGYGPVSLPALLLLLAMALLAGAQVWRSRLIIEPAQITVRRLMPGNTLVIRRGDLTAATWTKHGGTLKTRTYGDINFLRFGHGENLQQAVTAVLSERG